jgi:NAD(P)-dependent dehydrogenase (short-subunit alcohol dehydrogenase family)
MALRGLAGKTAIVTGAAGGMGRAVTARLVDEGCRVFAVDLTAEGAERARPADAGDRFHAMAADVSADEGASSYVAAAVERFGGVDLFFNNAGVFGEAKRIVDTPAASFDRTFAVNVRGAFLGMQAVLRQMIRQERGGAIVNTASAGGLRPNLRCSVYNATKAAVISLTETAALENGRHGVRVNCICPGFIETAMLAQAAGDHAPELAKKHPIPRVGEPSEIADLVAYLLSDESSFQTGGSYVVDGGLLLL